MRVDVVPVKPGVERQVYELEVLETIRGPELETLTYGAIVEAGEGTDSNTEPYLLTLCPNEEEGYYWPGVGANFPATDAMLAVAREVRAALPADQSVFADCDD